MSTVENQVPVFEGIPSSDDLARIADLLVQAGLETIELSDGKGARCFLRVDASASASHVPTSGVPSAPAEAMQTDLAVKAPYFGVLALTELAEIGTLVRQGDVVAQMRIGTLQVPVTVPIEGTVVEVVGQDGVLTGYGAVVVRIEPTV
ncbi:hypothetical protein [Gluconobacter roseus]|uniref:Lipoyl-binding domain-containing protein n=1 Tax=Gluconobacter roseus NBRC 3990 TaxID=1307950 RepID=A0A4Y3M7T4_9PROT|nr:hypothetical protein [Gluconobacter roseus]KXV43957.1 hypothetical protein AD943_05885 [Gluconobacter roseus]GBR48295.1 hypothetical protein AA3990_2066 [Gluconobacter roseus NBRC 3990]GEB03341.1 hypothetical protein GRO01_09170 [Gluconobacter roseus NBRC 3990]GLP93799.1 hypothetical protein GCM10007871_17770 [Gluconobacter roseus NBRC 3990]